MLRINKPILICFASNDGLGASAQNLAKLRNTKNFHFVPLAMDDKQNKPHSLVANFEKLEETLESIKLS